jgi:lipopolysaccharide export system permease protein
MIKILDKYIIRSFIKIFAFILAIFVFVVIMPDLLDKLDLYMRYKASIGLIFLHQISNLPEYLMQALPIVTLIAVLFSFSNLSQKNEITAIKAAGINIWRTIITFLIMGLIIGIGDFTIRETVVPKTSLYNSKVKKERIKKEKMLVKTDYYDQIIALPDNTRMTVGRLDTKAGIMKDIVMEKYNDAFAIEKLILAKEAVWENGSWVFRGGVVRKFDTSPWNETYFENYNACIRVTPKDLTVEPKANRYYALDVREFKKHINQLKTLGKNTVFPKILLHARFASIFSHIVVMMIAIPFAVGSERKLNKILSFIFAVCAALIYWCIQAITQSLGENLILSPIIAAWIPNIIFFIIGIYLLIKVKK